MQKNVEGNLITRFKVLPYNFSGRYEKSRENPPYLTSGPRLVSATSRGRNADHYNAMIRTALMEYYNNHVFLGTRDRIALVIVQRLRAGRGETEELRCISSSQRPDGLWGPPNP